MKVTFLGTGTSDGVPLIGCKCDICRSKDKKDKRTRSSIMITHNNKNYLIDTSIDFRYQMIREDVDELEAVFYTHHHADHVSGIVDLRSLNFVMGGKVINCYANEPTLDNLKEKYEYFFTPTQLGGGLPKVLFHQIDKPILLDDIKITPLKVLHGNMNILGYRFNNLAYITDASFISEETLKLLEGTETLILGALRYKPHPTHMSLQEAVDISNIIKPKVTYFTHMTHNVKHSELSKQLPKNIYPAYDTLKIDVL